MTVSVQVIQYILGWIDDNLHQPLHIEDIVRRTGYSRRHVQRLFLQYTGVSLGRYIRERRLLLAACDLRDSTLPVGDIVRKYGYDSRQSFYRIFTRRHQLPPCVWRRTLAGAWDESAGLPAVTPSPRERLTENAGDGPVS